MCNSLQDDVQVEHRTRSLAMQRLMAVIMYINMTIFMLTRLFINTNRLMNTHMLTPMIMFIITNTLTIMFIIISINTMRPMNTLLNTLTLRNTTINTWSILMLADGGKEMILMLKITLLLGVTTILHLNHSILILLKINQANM